MPIGYDENENPNDFMTKKEIHSNFISKEYFESCKEIITITKKLANWKKTYDIVEIFDMDISSLKKIDFSSAIGLGRIGLAKWTDKTILIQIVAFGNYHHPTNFPELSLGLYPMRTLNMFSIINGNEKTLDVRFELSYLPPINFERGVRYTVGDVLITFIIYALNSIDSVTTANSRQFRSQADHSLNANLNENESLLELSEESARLLK